MIAHNMNGDMNGETHTRRRKRGDKGYLENLSKIHAMQKGWMELCGEEEEEEEEEEECGRGILRNIETLVLVNCFGGGGASAEFW